MKFYKVTSFAIGIIFFSCIFNCVKNPIINGDDYKAPEPNPMKWQIVPNLILGTQVEMKAAIGIDDSEVEYYFTCVNDSTYNSGWQDSPSYSVKGLSEYSNYTFTVLC